MWLKKYELKYIILWHRIHSVKCVKRALEKLCNYTEPSELENFEFSIISENILKCVEKKSNT